MSVTFSVYVAPTKWAISCSCGDVNAVSGYDSYGDARDALALGVSPSCSDELCDQYSKNIISADVEDIPEVNVSNQNAAHLLSLLGLEFGDGAGSSTGIDFLGRVLMAQAVAPSDAGVPVTQQSGNFFDMGRRVGYADERLVEIEAVARYAVERNLPVSWS